MKKTERLEAIRTILKMYKVPNQQRLLELLKENDIDITQATLSRDLSHMKVGKISDPQMGHIYALPEQMHASSKHLSEEDLPMEGVQSLDFSGHLAVLKCLPSFAPSWGLVLDDLRLPEVIGTIAGDDTVLIVLNETVTREEFLDSLLNRIPGLRERI